MPGLHGLTPAYKASALRNSQPTAASLAHPLGTNFAGRDNFNQVIQGTRIAFEIGLSHFPGHLSFRCRSQLGALAGYFV